MLLVPIYSTKLMKLSWIKVNVPVWMFFIFHRSRLTGIYKFGDLFTSKKYSTSMGRHLSPRYGQVILVSGYPVLTAVNWSQHWCAIKCARKCESKHWFPCGADGRSYGHVITKFSRMGRLPHILSYGAPSTRALRARVELRYELNEPKQQKKRQRNLTDLRDLS